MLNFFCATFTNNHARYVVLLSRNPHRLEAYAQVTLRGFEPVLQGTTAFETEDELRHYLGNIEELDHVSVINIDTVLH